MKGGKKNEFLVVFLAVTDYFGGLICFSNGFYFCCEVCFKLRGGEETMAEDQEEESIFDEIGEAIEKVTRKVFRKKTI